MDNDKDIATEWHTLRKSDAVYFFNRYPDGWTLSTKVRVSANNRNAELEKEKLLRVCMTDDEMMAVVKLLRS